MCKYEEIEGWRLSNGKTIREINNAVHECHSFPTDYISAAILTALAVGIGNTHLVQMKQGWSLFLNHPALESRKS